MPPACPPYPPELKLQIVELVRAGRLSACGDAQAVLLNWPESLSQPLRRSKTGYAKLIWTKDFEKMI